MNGLIYGGRVVEVPFEIDVVDGRETGTWFDLSYDGARKRTRGVRFNVLHHQGGEGDAARVFNVLRTRKNRRGHFVYLGVHGHIGPDGTLTQMADLDVVLRHCGVQNGASVGCEIANFGWEWGDVKSPRPKYEDVVNGRRREYLRFWPAQVDAAYDWCLAVCHVLGLPYRIPHKDGRVRRDKLPEKTIKRFEGIVGHYHLVAKKSDPVPHLLDDLAARLTVPEGGTDA